jgi:hypothetical protein
MSQNVLAITEQSAGSFRKVTYEILSEGKRLATALGGSLTALVLGSGVTDLAAGTAEYGADRILVADDEALAEYTTEAYAQVCAGVIGSESPAIVITGASTLGRDLLARLSARLNAALATDCVALDLEDGQVVATRPMYGGKILTDIHLAGTPQLVTIRPNAMAVAKSDGQGKPETIAVDAGQPRTRFIEKKMETGKVDITEADIVVSGGRGMGGPDYAVVEAGRRTGGCRGRLPFGRGRRLAALFGPGGTDRQGGLPQPLRGLRYFRRHSAPGRHVLVQGHRGHQQGRRSADFRQGGLRHRGGPVPGGAPDNRRSQKAEKHITPRREKR